MFYNKNTQHAKFKFLVKLRCEGWWPCDHGSNSHVTELLGSELLKAKNWQNTASCRNYTNIPEFGCNLFLCTVHFMKNIIRHVQWRHRWVVSIENDGWIRLFHSSRQCYVKKVHLNFRLTANTGGRLLGMILAVRLQSTHVMHWSGGFLQQHRFQKNTSSTIHYKDHLLPLRNRRIISGVNNSQWARSIKH